MLSCILQPISNIVNSLFTQEALSALLLDLRILSESFVKLCKPLSISEELLWKGNVPFASSSILRLSLCSFFKVSLANTFSKNLSYFFFFRSLSDRFSSAADSVLICLCFRWLCARDRLGLPLSSDFVALLSIVNFGSRDLAFRWSIFSPAIENLPE